MPNYFSDYDTIVHFVSLDELSKNHAGLPHGGFVLRSGSTGDNQHLIEYSLQLDSNPEFTGSALCAMARAACRASQEGKSGAMTIFDLPLSYLSPKSGEELRSTLL